MRTIRLLSIICTVFLNLVTGVFGATVNVFCTEFIDLDIQDGDHLTQISNTNAAGAVRAYSLKWLRP